jgi:hypothetical protein
VFLRALRGELHFPGLSDGEQAKAFDQELQSVVGYPTARIAFFAESHRMSERADKGATTEFAGSYG